jgi:hypothetical protein
MRAGEIIRVGDLCIHSHVGAFIGAALTTTVLEQGAKCDIFWIDLMRIETNTVGQGFSEIYRIVR